MARRPGRMPLELTESDLEVLELVRLYRAAPPSVLVKSVCHGSEDAMKKRVQRLRDYLESAPLGTRGVYYHLTPMTVPQLLFVYLEVTYGSTPRGVKMALLVPSMLFFLGFAADSVATHFAYWTTASPFIEHE